MLAGLAAVAALAGPAAAQDGEVRLARLPLATDAPAASLPAPKPLGTADLARYREIFGHTRAGRWAAADRGLRRLDDPLLVGHALAERYLHPTAYRSSYPELKRWLDRYAALPQAERIYRLAAGRRPDGAAYPARPIQVVLHGTGPALPPARPGELWQRGLDAWSRGEGETAARAFARAAGAPDAAADERAGAAFWAARASLRAHQPGQATRFLHLAARASDGFYGLLAQQVLDASVDFDWQGERIEVGTLDRLERDPAVRRAVALSRIGERELADAELKQVAARARPELTEALAILAARFELPSVQVQIAPALKQRDGRSHDAVRYPVPRWQPTGGYQLEPTLVHAVIRAESGFDPYARSPQGAVGLMQLMPSTARLAAKAMRIAYRGERWLMHPPVNMKIGQGWLRQLAGRKPVDGSLVHLIAAYNAGEGRVAAWAKGPLRHAADDPLFYIESVPLTETRNYIKRVLANLWAYQSRRGGAIPSLEALAGNQWPEVEPAESRAVAEVRSSQRHARAD